MGILNAREGRWRGDGGALVMADRDQVSRGSVRADCAINRSQTGVSVCAWPARKKRAGCGDILDIVGVVGVTVVARDG